MTTSIYTKPLTLNGSLTHSTHTKRGLFRLQAVVVEAAAVAVMAKMASSRTLVEAEDAASWYCAVALVALILVGLLNNERQSPGIWSIPGQPCDEIYVVGEGETLHTISGKCGDPFIVERNPHIHDPDDVFPGLVIRLVPWTVGRQY